MEYLKKKGRMLGRDLKKKKLIWFQSVTYLLLILRFRHWPRNHFAQKKDLLFE